MLKLLKLKKESYMEMHIKKIIKGQKHIQLLNKLKLK